MSLCVHSSLGQGEGRNGVEERAVSGSHTGGDALFLQLMGEARGRDGRSPGVTHYIQVCILVQPSPQHLLHPHSELSTR